LERTHAKLASRTSRKSGVGGGTTLGGEFQKGGQGKDAVRVQVTQVLVNDPEATGKRRETTSQKG